jgi:hypothetical protein
VSDESSEPPVLKLLLAAAFVLMSKSAMAG